VVVASLVLPLWVTLQSVHDEGAEWRLTPSEAPPRVTMGGAEYRRVGEPTKVRPSDVTGYDYTPGGGLIMRRWPETAKLDEFWVLDHSGVVRHYVLDDAATA
jgi:hypothetical protein